jgi:hypothetical protein
MTIHKDTLEVSKQSVYSPYLIVKVCIAAAIFINITNCNQEISNQFQLLFWVMREMMKNS